MVNDPTPMPQGYYRRREELQHKLDALHSDALVDYLAQIEARRRRLARRVTLARLAHNAFAFACFACVVAAFAFLAGAL